MKGKSKKILYISIITSIVIILASLSTLLLTKNDNTSSNIDSEILRSMNYTQITDEDSKIKDEDGNVINDFVRFSAYFTRDLNNDGYAEKLLGTCRNVNSTDTLYMDLNVLSDGYLKDGKITINSTNFKYSMSMVKDSVLKNNYISNNVKVIDLNQINAGTQKLIIGDVIANIGNDTNNYSKVNSVTLTGTHVSDEGVETKIEKTINLTVDWHGETKASISANTKYYNYDDLNTETVSFSFNLNEIQEELILKDTEAKVTIPELNGFKPTEVKCTNSNVQSEYNSETGELAIKRSSVCDENGIITSTLSRSNSYTMQVTYPKEAYDAINSYTQLTIPIEGYYTGYNNLNEEFQNPYKSNIAKTNQSIIFRETPKGEMYNFYVDFIDTKYVSSPIYGDVISKQYLLNLYNSKIEDDEEENGEESKTEIKNKEYVVRWRAVRGDNGTVPSIIMSETKEENNENSPYGDKWDTTVMNNYVTNTGIYFGNANQFLEEDGTISVYNDDTNELIHTFTKAEWNNYSRNNPYKYENSIKHIRVETSKTNLNSTLSVYHVKELEVEKILNDFTKEQVKDVNMVYTYLTGICNIEGQSAGKVNRIDSAYYIYEKSDSKISIQTPKIMTQEVLKDQKIYIDTLYKDGLMSKWQNGEFLVEMPKEIVNMNIKNVYTNNNEVKIVAYDLFKKDDKYFIKIITENEIPESYRITIDCEMTSDPREPSSNKQLKLYSYNKYCNEYYHETNDTYDVNSNTNTEEKVGTSTTQIGFLSPISLITLETITNYDDEKDDEITVAPNVAEVEEDTKEATINISLTNNYPNTVNGVQILGKIPFEGNTYILNGKDLKSKSSTSMTNAGISLPDELKEKAVIYYSENENPSKDLENSQNGWTLKENVQDFSKIKTYLIDLREYTIEVGKAYTFNYVVSLPEDINYNLAAFSNHAVYYELNTDGGKLALSTEPNKVGVRIIKKFNFNLTKYKKNSNTTIPGVTYILKYEEENQEGEIEQKTRILTTNNEGKIRLENLYAEKTYKLQEIRVPNTCELDTEEKIITINADGTVNIDGTVRSQNFVDGKEFNIELEDEVKYSLEINKFKLGGAVSIDGVRFKLEDEEGNKETVRTLNGIARLEGLRLNKIYTLTENSVPANCEKNGGEFKFKVVRENGILTIQTITNTLLSSSLILQDEPNVLTPVLKVNVQNEIKYELNLLKQDKEGNKLPNIQFTIKGEGFGTEGTKFSTNKDGKLTIYGLSFGKEYYLEETKAEGYYLDITKNNKINFKVERTAGGLQIATWDKGENVQEVGTPSVTENELIASLDTVLENEKIPTYNLKLVKVNKDNEKLQGAEFKLTSLDTNKEQTVTTNEDGEFTFEGLYEYIEGRNITGEYTLEETFAPEGYILDNTKLKFKATRDDTGTVQVQILEGEEILKDKVIENVEEGETEEETTVEENIEKDITSDENTLTLNILNKPIFKLTKKGDNDVLLPNAKFTITDLDGNPVTGADGNIIGTDEVINGKTYKVVVTNENGEISANLPEGVYKAVEVEAPEGYELSEQKKNRTHYFTIGKSFPGLKGGPADSVKWAKSVKSDLISEFKQVIQTDDDGVIAVGRTYKNIDIDGNGTVDNNGKGYYDGIIVKYDKDGNIEWIKTLGGTNNEAIFSIAKDPNGGYVVAGYTDSTEVTLDNTVIDTNYFGNEDGIIVKLDSNGNYVWSQSIGGTGVDKINGVTVSESGDVAVVGSYTSTELNTNKEETDSLENVGLETKEKNAFLVVFGSSGTYKWSQNIGGANSSSTSSNTADTTTSSNTADTTGVGIVATDSGFAVTVNFIGTTYLNTGKTVSVTSKGNADGLVILYTGNGSVSWYKQIGSTGNDNLTGITKDKDGNIIAACSYAGNVSIGSSSVTTKGKYDGLVVKYSSLGDYITHKTIGGTDDDTISSVYATEDGGLLLGGWYYSSSLVLNGDGTNEITSNSGICDGLVMKLDKDYNLEWYDSIKGSDYDEITSVVETKERDCVVVGDYESTSVTIFNEANKLTNSKYTDGLIVRYGTETIVPEMPEMQEITVTNELKQYKITTEIGINSDNARTGGTITGDYNQDHPSSNNVKFVESVKHGYSSTKAIEMRPYSNYHISKIIINGEEIEFKQDENKNVILPEGYFENVTENKHIVVIFNSEANALTIKKQNEEGEPLEGAKFKISTNRDEGTLEKLKQSSSIQLEEPKQNNQYCFVPSGTRYISNNNGINNSTANSRVTIDLRDYYGSYMLTVNAEISSEQNYDYGYATITQSTSTPAYNDSNGRFMYISGTVSAQNYTYYLTGGNLYYLYLGYRKDGSSNVGSDRLTINNISLRNTANYYFEENVGTYRSTNNGRDNTTSDSCMKLDLTGKKGKYKLNVNAYITSQSGYDYGYVTVKNYLMSSSYYGDSSGRFVYISGSTSSTDYYTELTGGSVYYIYLGYRKDGSTSYSIDQFTINSITVKPINEEIATVVTNKDGIAKVDLPKDKYIIEEIQAPEGYELLDQKIRVEIGSGQNQEITVTNKKKEPITITKKDKNTNEPIPGVKFAIYSVNVDYSTIDFAKDLAGEYVGNVNSDGVHVVETNENGQIKLQLPYGYYKAVEIKAVNDEYLFEEDKNLRTTYFEVEKSIQNTNIEASNADVTINSIEDLVRFSNRVNSGISYEGKVIELTRTLDFNENSSYSEADSKDFDDYNGDGTIDGIKTELTKESGVGFKAIGINENKPFKGTFDGKGHEIKNIHINNSSNGNYGGLFVFVESGKILNLGLVGGDIKGNSWVGTFVGYKLKNGEIRNCYNKIDINRNSGAPNAGIVCYIENSVVDNCYNTADINISSGSAGIVYNATNSTISNCYNTGHISSSAPAGGIAYSISDTTINNCYNEGEITALNSGAPVAGIVVYLNGNSNKIINSYNIGDIKNEGNAGGIVGNNVSNSTIDNCHNEGNITAKYNAGGIVATVVKNNSIINNCYNTGKVDANVNGPAGGIAMSIEDSKISNCYNTGKIIAGSAPAGGIAYRISNSKVSNCYNLGDIECNNVAGGIAMEIANNSKIINCYNRGNVTASYPTGSVPAGGLSQRIINSEVINFYNTGIITADDLVGGIVQFSSNATMKNCYYLNTSSEKGIYGQDDVKGQVEAKTEEEMKSEDFAKLLNFNKINIEEATATWIYNQDDYPSLDKMEFIKDKEITITNEKLARVVVHHYLEGTGPEYGEDNEPVVLAPDELKTGKVEDEYTTSPKMDIEGYVLIKGEDGEYVIPENASGKFAEEEQHVYYYYNEKKLNLTVHHYLEGTENKVPLGKNEQNEDKFAEDEFSEYNEGDHYKTTPSQEVLQKYELVEVVGDEEKDIMQNEVVTYYYRIKKHEITTKVEIPQEEIDAGRIEKGGSISGEGQTPYETVEHEKSSKEDIIVKPDNGYRIKQIKLVSTNEEGEKQESTIYIYSESSNKDEIENAEITYKTNSDGSLTLTKFENVTEDKEVIVVFEKELGKLIVHHYIEGTTEKIYDDQITMDEIGTEIETSPVKKDNYVVVQEPENRVGTITKQTQEKIYYYQKQYKVTTDIIKYEEPNENGEMQEVIGGTISGKGESSYEDILKGRNSQKEIVITPNEGFEIAKVTINGEEFDYSELLKEYGSILLEKEFFKNVDEDKHVEVEFKRKAKVIVHYLLQGTGPEYGNEAVVLADEDQILGTVNSKYITVPNMNIKGYTLIKDENGEYILPENKTGTFTVENQHVYYYYKKDPLELIVHHYIEGTKDKVPLGTDEQGQIIFAEDEHKYYNEGDHYKTNPSEEVLKAYELVSVVGDEEKDITKNEEVIYYYRIKKHEITTKVEIPQEEVDAGRTEKGGSITGEGQEPYETVDHGKASKEDIVVTPKDGYRIKQIKLVSTGEDGTKKESIIYINAEESVKEETENAEIKYKENLDGSLILTKFENMTEDKEVIVVFEPIIGKVIVHHYIEGTTEEISEDEVIEGLVGTEVQTDKVTKEDYVLVQEPEDKNAVITEDTQEKVYYYQKQYKVTTDIIKYEEPDENGKMKEVIGGTISGKGKNSYEDILKGRNSQKEIEITPKDGFQITKITINGKEFDYSELLNENGEVILPKEFFKNVDENKHVEVEFRRKTKVHVKYLEVETKKELAEEELINGYVGKDFETERKNIPNYKTAKLEVSELGITNEKDEAIEPNGQMTKDEITIIYWYEKIPPVIIVKHIEKITTKTINEETGKEEIKVTEVLLDEEEVKGKVGEEKTTKRKEYEGYIPAENKEASKGINVGKEEDSKKVTLKEDEITEVIYWYEREFKITTDVIEHKEKVVNPQTGKEETVKVKGGSISGEDEKAYEKVIRSNDSTKEIKIIPDKGYRIKQILINDKEMIIDGKVAEDGSITLKAENGYFTNMQEDKHIEVEFERIPAKVIVKYKDSYTKESIADDKVITGHVDDKYEEKRLELEGYVNAEPEPENSKGTMTEDVITVTYWYTKLFKITTDVKEHEEKVINSTTGKEEKVKVKGGSITGEDVENYESVIRGETSTKEIIIKPQDKYRIKSLTINGKEIEIKDLLKEDNTIKLPFFENMQEDKHIVVEFERIPAKVTVKYLEQGTEKPIYKTENGKEYEEIDGYINDKYETKEKEIPYYELVKEKYPKNNKGSMTKKEIEVKYYYKKLLFNMKIEKEIQKITLNGQNVEVTDKNKQKLEIKYKELNETKLEIKYKIKVTNTEKVEGIAIIEEMLPNGFEFVKEKNTNWKEKDGKYTLITEVIKPGETKEYEITLKWNPEETNKGQKVNTAKIINTANIPEFEETTLDDNEDTAIIEIKLNKTIDDIINNVKDDIVSMPKTGQERIVYILCTLIGGTCIGILVWRKKKQNK